MALFKGGFMVGKRPATETGGVPVSDWRKRKGRLLRGGLLVTVGYILSPLSWWNDAFVNLPIAYSFAFLCGLLYEKLFVPSLVAGYWLTNIAGLLLMHYGFVGIMRNNGKKFGKKEMGKALLISAVYTLIIVLLVWTGWLRFPAGHLLH